MSSPHNQREVKPIIQRRRKFNEEKRLVTREETQKLLTVTNVVPVKKASGKWRMCVDFTNLNKACPKDPYPLPNIDSLVDNASRCSLLSFLDAFSRYNQIRMHPSDERKTTLMTKIANYCYKVNALRFEECWGDLPKAHGHNFATNGRTKCSSLRRRHGGYISEGVRPYSQLGGVVCNDRSTKLETQS